MIFNGGKITMMDIDLHNLEDMHMMIQKLIIPEIEIEISTMEDIISMMMTIVGQGYLVELTIMINQVNIGEVMKCKVGIMTIDKVDLSILRNHNNHHTGITMNHYGQNKQKVMNMSMIGNKTKDLDRNRNKVNTEMMNLLKLDLNKCNNLESSRIGMIGEW